MMCEQDEQLITQLYNRDFCPTEEAPYYYKFSFREILRNRICVSQKSYMGVKYVQYINRAIVMSQQFYVLAFCLAAPLFLLPTPGFLLILRENGDNWRGLTLTDK